MAGYQRYTDEDRDAAVEAFAAHGLSEAAHMTGIPKPTIASWARERGVKGPFHSSGTAKTEAAREGLEERVRVLRTNLRYDLLEKAADLLTRMDAEHVEFKGKDASAVTYPIAPASAVQAYATSIGILIDKFRLESGEATVRNETRDLTDTLDDHEREALRATLTAAIAEAAVADTD